MQDLAFYNAGCQDPRGLRRIVVLCRRLLRRVLRPIFVRQVELLQGFCDRLDRLEGEGQALRGQIRALPDHRDAIAAMDARIEAMRGQFEGIDRRHDALSAQMQTTVALGWDYVATVRRLAVLEDRVEALMARATTDDLPPSIPFPDAPEGVQSRVS